MTGFFYQSLLFLAGLTLLQSNDPDIHHLYNVKSLPALLYLRNDDPILYSSQSEGKFPIGFKPTVRLSLFFPSNYLHSPSFLPIGN